MTTDPTAQPTPTPDVEEGEICGMALGAQGLSICRLPAHHFSACRPTLSATPTPAPAQMSGPEHYRQAESLLGVDWMQEYAANAFAAAQVHATLALAAVTAELASHSAPPAYQSGGEWEALLHPERTRTDDSTNSADAPWESA